MTVSHPYFLTDVFSDRPLAGNQLAVFTQAENFEEEQLQLVAKEMNLSETAFVFPPQKDGHARVRYFTTFGEVPFAGHPTLGAACVVASQLKNFERGGEGAGEVRLETQKGTITIDVHNNDGLLTGWMTQPIPTVTRWQKNRELLSILNVKDPITPIDVYDNGIPHLYVVLSDPAEVAAIVPDFTAIRTINDGPRINVLAGSGTSYLSRMFSPFDMAMPEDPACGSAAGPLAAHLVRHGLVKSGDQIVISQGEFVDRPSTLHAVASTDLHGDLQDIRVGGSSVIVGKGDLYL